MNIDNTLTQDTGKGRMPSLVWVVIIFTLISCPFGGSNILGYTVSGYGWIIPLLVAMLFFLKSPGQFRFPLSIWLPWIFVVVIYQLFAVAQNSLQRSVMLLCPLIVGIAISTFRPREQDLDYFFKLCRYMTIAIIFLVLAKTKIFLTGVLPYATGLAPEVMTTAVLCCIFATIYVLGSTRALGFWAALATIPVIAVTRMGMFATAISLPLTLAPMPLKKRLFFSAIILVLGINLFYTDRIQRKMFYSGEGTMQEARWANPDFATSGRSAIWDIMWKEIAVSPYFGHGANASEEVISSIAPGITHPHNDWLRLIHDYGWLGTVVFFLTIFSQLIHTLKRAHRSTGHKRVLYYTGASSMLIFCLFMFTDNIILYAAFFGNLQFTILGLAYASDQGTADDLPSDAKKIKLSIKW